MDLKEFHSAYVQALGKKTYVKTVNGDFPAVLTGFDFMTRNVIFTLRDGTKEVSVDDIGSIDLFQPMEKDRLLPIVLASFNKSVTFELAGRTVKGTVVGITNERVDVQTADSVESLQLQSVSAAVPDEPIEVIKVKPAPEASPAAKTEEVKEEPAPEAARGEEEPAAVAEEPAAAETETAGEKEEEPAAEPEEEKKPEPVKEAPAAEPEKEPEKKPEKKEVPAAPVPAIKKTDIPRYGRIDPAALRASLLERRAAAEPKKGPEKEAKHPEPETDPSGEPEEAPAPEGPEADPITETPAEEIAEAAEADEITEEEAPEAEEAVAEPAAEPVEAVVTEEAVEAAETAEADEITVEETAEAAGTAEADEITEEEAPDTAEAEAEPAAGQVEDPVEETVETAAAEEAEKVSPSAEADEITEEESPEAAEEAPGTVEAEAAETAAVPAGEVAPASEPEAVKEPEEIEETEGSEETGETEEAEETLMSGSHVKKAVLDLISEDKSCGGSCDFSILENAFAGKDPKERREYKLDDEPAGETEESKGGFFGGIFKKRHAAAEDESGEVKRALEAAELTQQDADALSLAALRHPENAVYAGALLKKCASMPVGVRLSLAYRIASRKTDHLAVMKVAADRGFDDFKAFSAADIIADPEEGFNPYKALQNVAVLISAGYFAGGKHAGLAARLIDSLLSEDFIPVKNQESMHINIAAALSAACGLEADTAKRIGEDVLSRSPYAACVAAASLMKRGDSAEAARILSVFADGDGAPSGVRLLRAVLSGDVEARYADDVIGLFLDCECDSRDGFANACDKAVVRAELSGDCAGTYGLFVRMSGIIPDSIPMRRQIVRLSRCAPDGLERDLALFDAFSALCSGLPAGTETSVTLRKLIYLLYIIKAKNYPEVPERIAGLLSEPYDSVAGLYSDLIDAQSGSMLKMIAEDCERSANDGSVPEGVYLSLAYAFVFGDWCDYLRFAAGIGFVPDEYQKKMIPFRAGAFIRSLIRARVVDPACAKYCSDQAQYLFGVTSDALSSFTPEDGMEAAVAAVAFESRNTFDIVKRLALNDEKLKAALIRVIGLYCRLCAGFNIRLNVEYENEFVQDIGSGAIVRFADDLFDMSGERTRADYFIKCATYVFRGRNYRESLELGIKASDALAGQQMPKKTYRKLRSQIEALVFSCGLRIGSVKCAELIGELPAANLINVISWIVMNCGEDEIVSVFRMFDGERADVFRTVLYASSGRWNEAVAAAAGLEDGPFAEAADDYLYRAACYVKYLLDNKIKTTQRNYNSADLISEIAGKDPQNRGDFFYICGVANRSVEDLVL